VYDKRGTENDRVIERQPGSGSSDKTKGTEPETKTESEFLKGLLQIKYFSTPQARYPQKTLMVF